MLALKKFSDHKWGLDYFISPFANKSYLDCNFLKNKDSLGPEKEVLLCKLLLEGGYFLS